MGFLDSKEELLKVILTEHGRKKLSQGKLSVKWFSFFDDEVDYKVSSGIYGEELEALFFSSSQQPINVGPLNFDANAVSSSLSGNCALWLRSDQTLAAGAGGVQISQINDLTPNVNHMEQSIGSNRASVVRGEFGDFPGIGFTSADYYITDSTFTAITNSSGISLFAALKIKNTASNPNLLLELDTNYASSDSFNLLFNSNSVGTVTPGIGDTGGLATFGSASLGVLSGGVFFVKVLYNRLSGGGAQLTMSFNGGADEVLTFGSTDNVDDNFDNAFLYMGARAGSSIFFTGSVADLIIYDHILSSSQVSDVETYLSGRYLAAITSSATSPSVGYALSGWSVHDYYATALNSGPRGGSGVGAIDESVTVGFLFKPERLATGVGERRTLGGTWTDANVVGGWDMVLSGDVLHFGVGGDVTAPAQLTASYVLSGAHLSEVHTVMGVVEGTGDSTNSFKLYFDGVLIDQTAFTASGDAGILRNVSDANNIGIYNPDLESPNVSPVSRSLDSVLLLGFAQADNIALSASQVLEWHSSSRSNLQIQTFSGANFLWDVKAMANSASSRVPDVVWTDSIGGINQYITGTRLVIVEVDQ